RRSAIPSVKRGAGESLPLLFFGIFRLMRLRWLILGAIVVTAAALPRLAPAQERTEIYKCVDASGRPSYTNDRRETAGRKCELVTTQINVAPPPPPPPPR